MKKGLLKGTKQEWLWLETKKNEFQENSSSPMAEFSAASCFHVYHYNEDDM